MKPYGMSLSDHENCEKGCCAGNHVKLSGQISPGVRTRRKTARQKNHKEIQNGLIEGKKFNDSNIVHVE